MNGKYFTIKTILVLYKDHVIHNGLYGILFDNFSALLGNYST